MPVLSTVTVTLKDEPAEKAFLEAFTRGAANLGQVKGLISLSAWKQLGAERTYLAFSLWESEADIESWRKGEQEQANIKLGQRELLAAYQVQRFASLAPPRRWTKA